MYKLIRYKIVEEEIIDESDDIDYIENLKEIKDMKEEKDCVYLIEKEILEPIY